MDLKEGSNRLGVAVGTIVAPWLYILVNIAGDWEYWFHLIIAALICFVAHVATFSAVGWLLSTSWQIQRFRLFVLVGGAVLSALSVGTLYVWAIMRPEAIEPDVSSVMVPLLPIGTLACIGLPFATLRSVVWVIEGFLET